MALTIITGDDGFETNLRYKVLLSEFVGQYGDLSVEKFDIEDVATEQIFDAISSIPFMSSVKLVVIKGGGKHKEFYEKLASIVDYIPKSTSVILIDQKLDKRASYYKTFKAKTDFQEFNTNQSGDLSTWVTQQAQKLGGQIDRSSANFLIDRVGTDKVLLRSELAKLVTYQPNITRQNIENLSETTLQSTTFQLLDAAFSGNLGLASNLYNEQRAQRVEPQIILGLIAWQLHVLASIKMSNETSPDTLARSNKLSPYVVKKNWSLSKKLPTVGLKNLITEALELDVKLKRTAIDADEAIHLFLLSVVKATS